MTTTQPVDPLDPYANGTVGLSGTVTLTPLDDRLVIRELPAPELSAGGIILPETMRGAPSLEGVVVAVGPGRPLPAGGHWPIDVHPGDRVLYSRTGGTEVSIDGEDVLLILSRDVLAVITVEAAP